MKVSKHSWHYRMQNFLFSIWAEGPQAFKGGRTNYKPKNLCQYFWLTWVLVVSIPFWLLIALFIVIIYLIAVAWQRFIWHPLVRWWERKEKEWEEAEKLEPPKLPKPPSLFKQYLKARKEKVCPIIELVDE